jgi:DNA-binding NarL/FixJ family response regulator
MDQPTERIRVLVADDHPVFRRGMRAILGAEPDTELVGEATDGEEAVSHALELVPDVILMDLNMPKVTGIEATRGILEANPHTAILMLTMFKDDKSIFAAMRAGAHGYVLKGPDGTEMLRAIHAVASGEAIYSPTITRRLTEYFAAPGGDPKTSSAQAFPNLTEREHEILSLIAEGYTNSTIASRLYLSSKTVRNYVSSIFTKLEVTDRSQARLSELEAIYLEAQRRRDDLEARRKHLKELEHNKEELLASYEILARESLEELSPENRNGLYRRLNLAVRVPPDAEPKLSANVDLTFSKNGVSS